jgi:NFU1 iron-sulfur cluster scaffold homolog, mitochondrial
MLMIEDVDLTPNPQALKFILNEKLLLVETRNFKSKVEAADDPFAEGIFNFPGVVSVFYMDKFVTIEKSKETNWGQIQKPFIEYLKTFNKDLIPPEKSIEELNENTDEILKQIHEIIDMRVKPALANDGGGLEILGMDGFVVHIRYQGACGSCPSAISGTLNAIEGLLKRDVHPAIEVVAG